MDCDEVLHLLKSRRSIRRYTEPKPNREQIDRIIEAACWAPSNHNRQGWKFIVFENKQEIIRLATQVRQTLQEAISTSSRLVKQQADELIYFAGAFEVAPLIMLVLHKKSPAISKEILPLATSELASGEALSAALAVQNLLLASHAMGLGACIMTAPLLAGKVWFSLSNFPMGFIPTCLVTLGYAAEEPPMPKRKDLKHVIEYRC